MYLFFGGVACAVAGGYIASQKNRSAESWAFICFFTSIIGIIAIAAVPALPQERKSHLKKKLPKKTLQKSFPKRKLISTNLFCEIGHGGMVRSGLAIHLSLSLILNENRLCWVDVLGNRSKFPINSHTGVCLRFLILLRRK